MNPPWPVYPSPGSPYMYELPRKEGTNGFAIASFVLGIAGFLAVTALLSVVFGIIALLRIRDAPQRGKGLAIAGLILSSLWIVLGILGIIGAAIGPQPRVAGSASPVPRPTPTNQSTHSTQGRTEDVFLLRPGDCFLNPNTALGVDFVTVIPCTQPHDAQVFALFKATGTSYPGAPALKRQADPGCHARIAGNLDSSKLTDTMNLNFLFPQAQAWLDGHRLITCIIVDSTRDLTSSLRPPGAPTS